MTLLPHQPHSTFVGLACPWGAFRDVLGSPSLPAEKACESRAREQHRQQSSLLPLWAPYLCKLLRGCVCGKGCCQQKRPKCTSASRRSRSPRVPPRLLLLPRAQEPLQGAPAPSSGVGQDPWDEQPIKAALVQPGLRRRLQSRVIWGRAICACRKRAKGKGGKGASGGQDSSPTPQGQRGAQGNPVGALPNGPDVCSPMWDRGSQPSPSLPL